MADSSNTIAVTGTYAAEEFPELNQYAYGSPSQYLDIIASYTKEGEIGSFTPAEMARMERLLPKKMVGLHHSGKKTEYSVKTIAECFKAQDGLIGSGILEVLVADTIAEGAQGVTSMRNLLTVYNMGGGTVKFPAWTKRRTAPLKAKNAEFEDIAQDLFFTLVDAKEYGYTATVSKSILEDTGGSFLSSLLNEMGAGMELTIDKMALEALINFSGTADTISVPREDALKGLARARAKVAKNMFTPSVAAVSPMFHAEMQNTYIPGYHERAMSLTIEGGGMPKFAGLSIGETASIPTPTTVGNVVFDWESSTNVGAIVFDPSRAPLIGMRKDITFDEFDNILKFATNPCVIMRMGISDPLKAEGPDGKTITTAQQNELRLSAKRVVMSA